MRHINALLHASVCALAGLTAHASDAPSMRVALKIEPQPVRAALKELSDQAGVQVLLRVDNVSVDGVVVPKVSGEMTLQTALNQLLENSGLKYEFVNERTVRISAAGTESSKSDIAGEESKRPLGVTLAQSESPQTAEKDNQGATTTNRSEPGAPQDSTMLEEIVVTAQKREERLIDTPQSVSVLSAESLNKLGATQFRDFANTVPGLTFSTAGAGNTQVSLRGVTIGQDLGATVGIYVDETPYGSSQVYSFGPYLALDVGLFDLERIEVLRGPQGTLYGASTMGGLIKYVTKRPDAGQFSGSVRAGLSSTERGDVNYDVAAVVNIPLAVDKAALRASAFESHDGGYIDNIALGRDGANRSDIYGGRLDFLFSPTEELDIRLIGFAQNIARDGEATADYTFAGAKPIGSLNQSRVFDEPFDQRFRLVSGTAAYHFGAVSLTSISTYQTAETKLFWDITLNYAPLFNSFGLGPFSAVGNPNRSQTDKFSEEIRLASDGGGTLEWVAGAFYTREKSELETGFVLRDLGSNPVPNNLFIYRAPTLFKEHAIFGDLTWRLTDKFDLTGGARYASNDQEFTQFGTTTVPTRESGDDIVTYLGSARYHVSDRATAYLRYATGYRPGGTNIATSATQEPTFDADKLASYEAGFKAETDDRRFAIDVSGYYIDWNNIQMSVNIGGFTSYLNAPGGASVRGAELSLTGRPAAGLTLSGAFAYQDAQLDEADANLGGAKGERLPNVPRFTATLNADYEFSGASLAPTVGATLRHVGERRSSFDASDDFPQYRLPEYTIVDLRTGIAFGKVDAQLYVHNLFDERGQQSLFFGQFGARVAISQPRTVGISVTTRF